MSLVRLQKSLNIQASPEIVFELVSSSRNWQLWTPVSSVEIERESGPDGTEEIRVFALGPSKIREQIVDYDENRQYSYVLLSGLPVDDYRVDIELKPEFGGCTTTWTTVFRPKVRGTGAVLTKAIGTASGKMLRGLSAEAETRSLASKN